MSDIDYRTKLTRTIIKINPNTPNRAQRRTKTVNRVRCNDIQTMHPSNKASYSKIVRERKINWILKQTKHSKILTNKVKEYFKI